MKDKFLKSISTPDLIELFNSFDLFYITLLDGVFIISLTRMITLGLKEIEIIEIKKNELFIEWKSRKKIKK